MWNVRTSLARNGFDVKVRLSLSSRAVSSSEQASYVIVTCSKILVRAHSLQILETKAASRRSDTPEIRNPESFHGRQEDLWNREDFCRSRLVTCKVKIVTLR